MPKSMLFGAAAHGVKVKVVKVVKDIKEQDIKEYSHRQRKLPANCGGSQNSDSDF